MDAERIVALIVGVGGIMLGAMLLPDAKAWHRRHPPKPLEGVHISFSGSSPWLMRMLGMRALPVTLIVAGLVLVLVGLLHR